MTDRKISADPVAPAASNLLIPAVDPISGSNVVITIGALAALARGAPGPAGDVPKSGGPGPRGAVNLIPTGLLLGGALGTFVSLGLGPGLAIVDGKLVIDLGALPTPGALSFDNGNTVTFDDNTNQAFVG